MNITNDKIIKLSSWSSDQLQSGSDYYTLYKFIEDENIYVLYASGCICGWEYDDWFYFDTNTVDAKIIKQLLSKTDQIKKCFLINEIKKTAFNMEN